MTDAELSEVLRDSELAWDELRIELLKLLAGKFSVIGRIDRSQERMRRYLGRAQAAEQQGRRCRALWWYLWLRETHRESAGRMQDLCELALKTQAPTCL